MDYNYDDYWKGQMERREAADYYRRIYGEVQHLFRFSSGEKIIDVGGGNGQMLRYLGVEKATVIDISDSGLEVAKKLGYGTIKANIQKKFPVPDGSYDTALCNEVLEHLDEPSKTLSEICRILKPKGTLYLSVPNMRPDGSHHKIRLSLQELEGVLEKTGFRVVWLYLLPKFRWTAVGGIAGANRRFRYIAANVLSLIPNLMKGTLTRKYPNFFAGMFICKCEKIPNG